MHWQRLVLGRQKEVQCAEDSFFHFTGVSGSANENGFVVKTQNGEVALARTVALWNRLKTRGVNDGPLGVESVELRFSGAQEHVIAEQVVLGELVDDAQADLH